jgi:hypothetical protein
VIETQEEMKTAEADDGSAEPTGPGTESVTGAGSRSKGEPAATDEAGGGSEHSEQVDDSDERPEGVPSKATRVVKEINDNRYHYWQWRDGESVKSKYDRPVDPS